MEPARLPALFLGPNRLEPLRRLRETLMESQASPMKSQDQSALLRKKR
jgi:hypothetical protein